MLQSLKKYILPYLQKTIFYYNLNNMPLTPEEQKKVADAYMISMELAKSIRNYGECHTQFTIVGSKSLLPMWINGPIAETNEDVKSALNNYIVYGCDIIKQKGEKVLAVISWGDTKLNSENIDNMPPSVGGHKIDVIMTTCSTREDTIIHYLPYIFRDGKINWFSSILVPKDKVKMANMDVNQLFPRGF